MEAGGWSGEKIKGVEMVIKSCEDLDVYNKAFEAAMLVFDKSKQFPKEEQYSLVDQMRRSSRSIAANIREGFARRKYPDVFARHLNIALGSSEETITWIDFSESCGYLAKEQSEILRQTYKEIGAMLYKLMKTWQKF